jgi:hypothetical protein
MIVASPAYLHLRPPAFGRSTSRWYLALVATVRHENGWKSRTLSVEVIRRVLKWLVLGGGSGSGAGSQPGPGVRAKLVGDGLIAQAVQHPGWVIGFRMRLGGPGWTSRTRPSGWSPTRSIWPGTSPRDLKGCELEDVACYVGSPAGCRVWSSGSATAGSCFVDG